jgi:VCBS repeat-containing protein
MRYEDASTETATASQADAPSILNANNDVDVIPAGHYGPATGNAISGAGTISGSAGADMVDGEASITAIQGAGGTDTSFSGGSLQVAGQYGVLTINAQGAYSYVRNQGTPDGVSDIFSYTLSSRDGGRDIAQLTIDIGKTATVVRANAFQVVPGPDGVVTLPAGVELSDIHVVGSNLVVDLPDGTQIVIVDGAVFVPQIVLGTIEIPAGNLAALLIDSEPTPAAGPPQSSGGNFAVPVAPLDPGVPLGDLIPPTELGYTPPEFNELINAIEDDEDVLITDLVPSVSGGDAAVDEDDLPAGSDSAKESLTVSGSFTISAPDGVASLTVGSLNVIVDGLFQGGALVTPLGNMLTITGYDAATGVVSYSYALGAAETHPNGAGENSLFEDFLVTLTDEDGDVDTDTLSVNVIDDVPTANDDAATLTEGGPTFVNVDVDTNDVAGADGPGVRAFTTTAGTYGNLTLNPDGTQTYTLNAAGQLAINGLASGATLTDSFPYTLTDGDGDGDPATLVVTLTGANDPPLIFNLTPRADGGEAVVDEDDLADGSSPNAAALTVSSSFNILAPDGIDDLTVGGIQVIIDGVFQTGATGLSPLGNQVIFTGFNLATGEISVSYTLLDNEAHASGLGENNPLGQLFDDMTVVLTDVDGESATDTLSVQIIDDVPTAVDDTVNQSGENTPVTFGVFGNDIFGADGVDTDNSPAVAVTFTQPPAGQGTVSYNVATGQFTFTPAPGQQSPTSFTYTITDGDGDPSTATVTINLEADSVPIVTAAVAAVDDDGLPGGNAASVIGDLDANAGEVPLSASEAVYNGTFGANFGNDAPGTFSLAAMHGTSGSVGTETVNYAWDAITNMLTATGPRGVLFDVVINPATGAYTVTLRDNVLHDAGGNENDATAALTFTATDNDGDPTNGTLTITFDDDAPTATNGIAAVDDDGLAGGNPASVIGDLDANAGEAAPANPSEAIFHGQLAVSGGADAIATYSFASMHGTSGVVGIETVNYAWDAAANTLTATGPRGALFNVVVNPATGEYDLTLLDNVLHVSGGAQSGVGNNENGDATANLMFTATDGDGDSANGTITVTFDDDAPTLGTIQDGTANNDPVASVSVGTLNLTIGADSPASVTGISVDTTGITSGGKGLVTNFSGGVLTAYQDANGNGIYNAAIDTAAVFTLSVDPSAGGSGQYSFNLIAALDSVDIDLDFKVFIADADRDPVSGEFTINVADGNSPSVPEADSQEQQQQKAAANTNTVVLAAAVAAAGMAATSAAAHDEEGGDKDSANNVEAAPVQLSEDSGSTGSEEIASSALDGVISEAKSDEPTEASSDANSSGGEPTGGHSLTADDVSPAAQPADLLEATDAPVSLGAASIVAPTVSMPSAEALIAAKLEDGATAGSPDDAIIGKVLIDALEAGGADANVDALLEALPAQESGANAALETLASPPDAAGPAWDAGHSGGWSANANFTMEAMTLHHDAVQPVANG